VPRHGCYRPTAADLALIDHAQQLASRPVGKAHGEGKSMKPAGVNELLVASQHTATYEADR